MQPLAVVENLYVFKYAGSGLVARLVSLAVDQLVLQLTKEALGQCVVVVLSSAAHALAHL